MTNRTPLDKRYDFVMFFDVQDGNPNGDPDAGNLPRVDAETGMGLITDVCLKRKVRNYVHMIKNAEKPYDIFVKEKAVLNAIIDQAHEQKDVQDKEKGDKTEAARMWMCNNYFDVRTFGAVMSTGKNAGQVRGPIQLTFSRSVDPVVAMSTVLREWRLQQRPRRKNRGAITVQWAENLPFRMVYIVFMVLFLRILPRRPVFPKRI